MCALRRFQLLLYAVDSSSSTLRFLKYRYICVSVWSVCLRGCAGAVHLWNCFIALASCSSSLNFFLSLSSFF